MLFITLWQYRKTANYYKAIYDDQREEALKAAAKPKEIHQQNNSKYTYGSVPSTVKIQCGATTI